MMRITIHIEGASISIQWDSMFNIFPLMFIKTTNTIFWRFVKALTIRSQVT